MILHALSGCAQHLLCLQPMSGSCCAGQEMMGPGYWHFTVNELGEKDIAAQLDHIHVIKCRELPVPASSARDQNEAAAKAPHQPESHVRRPYYR